MEKNVTKPDRIARFILAAVLIILYGTHTIEGTAGVIALIIAGVMLATASMSFCPLYKIISMSPCCGSGSCDTKKEESHTHEDGGCCGHCGSEDEEEKK